MKKRIKAGLKAGQMKRKGSVGGAVIVALLIALVTK